MSNAERGTKLLHIGFQNAVVAARVVAIINANTSFGKRLRDERSESRMLIDATQGRKTRSIVIMDSNHIVLSAMNPQTLIDRFASGKGAQAETVDTED